MERPEEKLLACFGMKLVKQLDFYRPGAIDESLTRKQMIHELSHYQVATPSKRLLVNFGLGEDTNGTDSIFTVEKQIQEETRAVLLTLYWFEEWSISSGVSGFRYKGRNYAVVRNMRKQNQETRKALDWLLGTNLLDHNLRPMPELNTKEEK